MTMNILKVEKFQLIIIVIVFVIMSMSCPEINAHDLSPRLDENTSTINTNEDLNEKSEEITTFNRVSSDSHSKEISKALHKRMSIVGTTAWAVISILLFAIAILLDLYFHTRNEKMSAHEKYMDCRNELDMNFALSTELNEKLQHAQKELESNDFKTTSSAEYKNICELKLYESDVYKSLHRLAIHGERANDEILNQLRTMFETNFNKFLIFIQYETRLSENDTNICLLTKCGFKSRQIAALLIMEQNSVYHAKSRILKKITGTHGRPNELDTLLETL